PQVAFVYRPFGNLFKVERFYRIAVLAVGQAEEESRQGQTKRRCLGQSSECFPSGAVFLIGGKVPVGWIGRLRERVATDECRNGGRKKGRAGALSDLGYSAKQLGIGSFGCKSVQTDQNCPRLASGRSHSLLDEKTISGRFG